MLHRSILMSLPISDVIVFKQVGGICQGAQCSNAERKHVSLEVKRKCGISWGKKKPKPKLKI